MFETPSMFAILYEHALIYEHVFFPLIGNETTKVYRS